MSTATTTPGFPFSAVVGHDDLRLALLLNAVHPGVGGVLVRGEKGTAKSTAVRALAALLPAVAVVEGCRFACDPADPDPRCPDGPHPPASAGGDRPARLVELPVGASEDRLVGSLDLEKALSQGVRAYQPGLLADAHRGVLYVDEVNLLHDHLVDLLLDAAAMGRAHVERDGVSVAHASRFLLVGTMNPEEGELRPQLLDRFGLAVEVRAARDVDTRVEVVRRRMAFEDDPAAFAETWAAADTSTAARIADARSRVAAVALPDAELRRIASVCAQFDVDGMRADLVIARAAVAHAAWRGADAVAEEDVRVAARLALPHRRRRDPFDEPGISDDALDDAFDRAREDEPEPDPDGPGEGQPEQSDDAPRPDSSDASQPPRSDPARSDPARLDPSSSDAPPPGADDPRPVRPADGPGQAVPPPSGAFRARRLEVPGLGEGAPGRRSRARTDAGRVVRAAGDAPRRASDVHLSASVLAAAPHQHARGRTGGGALRLTTADLRRAEREGREGNLVLFAVDASGSMAARKRMSAVGGAVLALLRDAYQRRDKVGLVTFRGTGAELVLPPTSSVPTAQVRMAGLRTGGRTPLADGLLRAREVLRVERLRDPRRRPLLVVLTDGRATVPASLGRRAAAPTPAPSARRAGTRQSGDAVADACRAAALLAAEGVAVVVVDCESGPVRLGLAGRLAAAAGGELIPMSDLSADAVTDVVRTARAA